MSDLFGAAFSGIAGQLAQAEAPTRKVPTLVDGSRYPAVLVDGPRLHYSSKVKQGKQSCSMGFFFDVVINSDTDNEMIFSERDALVFKRLYVWLGHIAPPNPALTKEEVEAQFAAGEIPLLGTASFSLGNLAKHVGATVDKVGDDGARFHWDTFLYRVFDVQIEVKPHWDAAKAEAGEKAYNIGRTYPREIWGSTGTQVDPEAVAWSPRETSTPAADGGSGALF